MKYLPFLRLTADCARRLILQSSLEILRHLLYTSIYYTIPDTVAKIKIWSICSTLCQRLTARRLIMTQ